MKRFTFELAALLTLRRREEERVMMELADKNREIIGKQQELDGVTADLKALQASEKKRRDGNETVLELRYSVAYRYKLKADMLALGRSIQDLLSEAETIRARLTKATQTRKALEMVREKKHAAWKKEASRREQNFIDDVSQQRYIARDR